MRALLAISATLALATLTLVFFGVGSWWYLSQPLPKINPIIPAVGDPVADARVWTDGVILVQRAKQRLLRAELAALQEDIRRRSIDAKVTQERPSEH